MGSATAAAANAVNSATTVVNVSAATAPTTGQTLTATSGTAATWQTPSGGSSVNVAALGFGLCPVANPVTQPFPWQFALTTTQAPTSASLYAQPVSLTAGQIISNISFFTATTAATTPTHWFTALYRWDSGSPMQMAHSLDQTTTALAATTLYTLPMVTPYTIPSTGTDTYYLGFSVTATTTPTVYVATNLNSNYGPSGGPAKLKGFNIAATGTPGTDGVTTITSPAAGGGSCYWICGS